MADNNNGLGYFIVGMGIGVAVGLLVAPRSGEETRRILREKADEGTDYVRGRAEEGREYVRRRGEELRNQAGDIIEKGREVINRQKDQLHAAVDAGRQAYRETVNDTTTG